MQLTVKCFATLNKYQPSPDGAYELETDGQATLSHLVDALGMNPDDVTIMFINGRHANMDAPLADGDKVGLFPAVGGG